MSPRLVLTMFLAALSAPSGRAQDLGLERVTVLDPEAAGIKAIEDGETTTALQCRGFEIVFSRPVSRWEVGELPGGKWVVLAGGAQPGVDFYLFDPSNGEVGLPFHVRDALRLPGDFGHGNGSWPLASPPHLFLFAVEKSRRCEFFAVDFTNQVPSELTSKSVAIEASGFDVGYDQNSQQIEVSFRGVEDRLTFVHPLAPKLAVEPRTLDFGSVPVGATVLRTLTLRNAGRRPATLLLSSEHEAFSVRGDAAVDVPAGGERRIDVAFAGADPAIVLSALKIDSAVVGVSTSVPLRGEVRAAMVAEPETPEVVTQSEPGERSDTSVPAPAPATPLPTLSVEDLGMLTARRLDEHRILVRGSLGLDAAAMPDLFEKERALALEFTNPATKGAWSMALDASQQVRVCVRAGAGDRVEVALRDATGMTDAMSWLDVRPGLRVVGDRCVVDVAPDRPFFLMSVEPDASGEKPVRVLRAWRGRADGRGRAVVPLSAIPRGREPVYLAIGERRRDGTTLAHSELVRVEGE